MTRIQTGEGWNFLQLLQQVGHDQAAEPNRGTAMSTAPAGYKRIANDYTEKIRSGELPPGTKLPSTRQIAEMYGVGIGVAYRALSLLHDRDLIIGQPGRGTYVAER